MRTPVCLLLMCSLMVCRLAAAGEPLVIATDVSRFRQTARHFGVLREEAGVNTLLVTVNDRIVADGTLAEEWLPLIEAAGLDVYFQMRVIARQRSAVHDGVDWFKTPRGLHRWDFREQDLREMAGSTCFRGFLFPEISHYQQTRCSLAWRPEGAAWCRGGELPMWVEATGMTLDTAFEETVREAAGLVTRSRRHNLEVLGNYVMPALMHPFARAGFGVAPKFLKESHNSLMFATAVGAALQYGHERLVIHIDLWHGNSMPGHSVERFEDAVKLAWWLGATGIFQENSAALLDPASGRLTDYGRALGAFAKRYAPAHPRPYTFRDLRPKVAVVRFPDGYWGQSASPPYPEGLYGGKDLLPTQRNRDWIDLAGALTSGRLTHPKRIYGWREPPLPMLTPLDGVAVFDHMAGEKDLASASLIILTGHAVSEGTLDAVRARVRAGATCLCIEHLAPADARSGKTDGKGTWVVVRSFKDGPSAALIRAHTDARDEIRYCFGESLLRVKSEGGRLAFFLDGKRQ